MNCNVADIGGEILAVSQCTLYPSTRKGNRPSWACRARGVSQPLFEGFVDRLSRALGRPVGVFGADEVGAGQDQAGTLGCVTEGSRLSSCGPSYRVLTTAATRPGSMPVAMLSIAGRSKKANQRLASASSLSASECDLAAQCLLLDGCDQPWQSHE